MNRFLLACLLCIPALAETYYIDFVSGDNSTNGLCATSAWKNVPGDPTATGVPAAYTPVPGDRFLFKGGVNYDSTWLVSHSGSPGFPILYHSTNTFGTGWAIIDRAYKAGNIIQAVGNVSNLVFRGFDIQNVGGPDLLQPTNFVWLDNPCIPLPPNPGETNIGVRSSTPETPFSNPTAIEFGDTQPRDIWLGDMNFVQVGFWTNASCLDGGGAVQGKGIEFDNAHNITITNVNFADMSTPISFEATGGGQGMSNAMVLNCTFTGRIRWGIDISARNANAKFDGIVVDGCRFYNYPYYNAAYWPGCNNENKDNPHVDGMFWRSNNNASVWTNNIIRNSFFYSDIPSGQGGTAEIYLSLGPSVDIYNNIFISCVSGPIQFNRTPSAVGYGRIRIWNNTFVFTGNSVHDAATIANTNYVFLELKNNAFYQPQNANSASVFFNSSGRWAWTCDYNLYYNPGRTSPPWNPWNWAGYHTWTWIQGTALQELNGMQADPKFANLDLGTPGASNMMPAADSPLRGAGQDLSAHFTTDYYGRPRGSTWDIGAIQFYEGP